MGLAVSKVSSKKRGTMSVRKKTKHTLSNEYQIVFETTGKAMVIVEEDATISLANAEFEKLSGYTKKEIEGKKSWTEFVTRDDRKRVREYHRLRKTDPMLAPRSFEFRFLDRHETVKNVVLTIGQIPGTNKSMASLLDITDRRRDEKQARGAHTASEERLESKTAELIEANEALEAEVADLKRKVKKLEESEKLYRNLAENVDFGINLIDADYNIMMINSAQTRNFKKTNDQIIGGKCYQEFEKRDTVCPHCPGVQTMATGQPAEAETEGIRDDGSRFHVRIQTFPVFGQDGTTNGFIEVVEDITNRTQTEEALRESEERFRRLIETTKVGVSAIDEKGVITYANNRFCEIWGYSVDEIMGRPVFDFLDEENRKILKENLAKRKKGGSDSYEISWTRKHGSKVPTILSPTPRFDADGQFIGSYGFITDISERRRTEDALKESEGRFKMLAENAPFAISVMTPDRTFEYFNPLFTELFGYTKEDLPDKDTWFKKAYPDEEYRKKVASTWKRDIAEDVNGGERGLRVFTVRCKDGQDKIISFKIVYLNDGKQYLTYRDITARVKAEETLQESEERYRTLVENIKLGISLIDSDYNVIMVNAALSKRLKKQAGEMIGKKCYREFLNRDSICPNCPGVQAMATGKSAEDKMEGVRDDGRPFYMRLQAFPVFGQDGTTNGFIEVVEDITKRKQMEEALRESEERFRRLIETTKVGVSAIDEKGVITYANNRFGEIWGYSVDEIMGRHVFDFLDEDNRKTLKEHLAKRKQGEADSYEITWTRKDGGKVPTILSPTPNFGADGRYKGSYGFITDITERKQMEESLRESEGRFKMLAENAPFAISVMAPDRTFEYFNPRFTEVFGYTKEDLPDKDTWFKKAYPDEEYSKKVASKWKRDIAEDVKGGEQGLRVFTVRCKDGQDKIISFKIVYLNDGKQYLTYRDITDRVKAEETLQESEERYRTLVENIKLGINLIDSDYNITMVNAALSKRVKKQASEMIGKKCYREFLNRDSICPNCPGVQAMATGKPAEDKVEGVRDDEEPFYMRLQAFPVFGQDGTTNGFIEVVEDITKRKRMEEELQKSEALYRSLIETTKVGVSAINENGVIIYANDRHCEIWGYPLNEIMGRRVSEFLDEENLKILQDQLVKRKEGGQDPYEISWRRKDGQNVPTILAPTPIFDAYDHFKGSYGFITDITERKRIEEQLQRYAAELERSNEEIKNFAYIVSHDLRVPLVNLKGYTSELQSALEVIGPNMDTALPHLDEDKRSAVAMALHEDVPEALEFITNSVSRMDSFINAVLQLSRLGRRDLKPEPIDMNALVQMNVETLAHQIQERGIKVTVGSLPQVVADRTSMEQIMGNILGNAVKYLDSERPGQIEVTAETNNGKQIFRIRDNGRGIANEDMHKVFAPFRRAGKQDTPGEGMGLAYVQTLVRRHNGRIWCESDLGQGTTMTFTISPHRAEGEDHVSN